jgi:hypothetical protein
VSRTASDWARFAASSSTRTLGCSPTGASFASTTGRQSSSMRCR